jgi:hypothetical protein
VRLLPALTLVQKKKNKMKVAQIQDIGNLADGSVIGEIRAQVKAAFPPKLGEGKYGPWRVQACILKDGTGEVRASYWGQDDLQTLVGQTLTFKSQASAKGLQGINVQFSKHSSTNELKITDKAGIITDAQSAVESYRPAGVPATSAAPRPAAKPSAEFSVADEILKRSRLYLNCYAAAKSCSINIERSFGPLPPEHFQALVSSLFISADRAGLHQHLTEPVGKTIAKQVKDEIPMDDPEPKDEFLEEAGW